MLEFILERVYQGSNIPLPHSLSIPPLSLLLYTEITVGLQQTSYNVFETGGPVSICAQIFLGTLERSVSLMLTSMDGNATGTQSIVKFNMYNYSATNNL